MQPTRQLQNKLIGKEEGKEMECTYCQEKETRSHQVVNREQVTSEKPEMSTTKQDGGGFLGLCPSI